MEDHNLKFNLLLFMKLIVLLQILGVFMNQKIQKLFVACIYFQINIKFILLTIKSNL